MKQVTNMKKNIPKIGQLVTVRGVKCRIFKIREFGTIDVESICGNYAFRLSGLNF
jgi:hypothetical protein